MSKELIGLFDPFDENGGFDSQKVVDYIKETIREPEENTNDND